MRHRASGNGTPTRRITEWLRRGRRPRLLTTGLAVLAVAVGAAFVLATFSPMLDAGGKSRGESTPSASQTPRLSGSPTGPAQPHLSPEEEKRITGAIDEYMAEREGRVAVSVQELTTGVGYDYQADREFVTGSLVKLDILALTLLQVQEEERTLSGEERELLKEMIRHSDNDVTDDLYERVGFHSGLAEGNERIGLRDTEPGAEGVWGSTTTTASDQQHLLRAVFTDDGPLSRVNRDYARGLLGGVAQEQAWGVSAAGDPETAELKNGWVPLEDDGDRWVINSAGRVEVGDREYLIVVLSDRQPDYWTGVECVEHVVTEVTDAIEESLD